MRKIIHHKIRIVICGGLNFSRVHANYVLINHICKSYVICAIDEKINS